MTENDLMNACLNRGEQPLWNYLLANDELCKKYPLGFLQDMVSNAFSLSAYDFFMQILTNGVKEKFISRFGVKCLDILYEFLDKVTSYNDTPSLQNFLEWFLIFDHEIKRESFAQENSVRLMTAHASKGLQAPFVILADAHFYKATNDRKIIDVKNENDAFSGILLWNFASNGERSKNMEKLHNEHMQLKSEESQRLLYVAMTRAENFLYILGEKSRNNNKLCWYKLIEDSGAARHIGNYQYYREENENATLSLDQESETMPNWFFEKLPLATEITAQASKTEQTIYGEYVHMLLNEIPRQAIHVDPLDIEFEAIFDTVADDVLSKINLPILSSQKKDAAKAEALRILRNYAHIFDPISSIGEVPFVYNGKEGRIDRVVFQDDQVLIVDFKTGAFHEQIPAQYMKQLEYYQDAVCEMIGKMRSDVKTAILWTQSSEFCLIH
jgi:ATP-dependent helicase/nuclease subunit A